MHMSLTLLASVLVAGNSVLHKPDTVKRYLLRVYNTVRNLPSNASKTHRTQKNGVENYNITWGSCYMDYNIGGNQDGMAFYDGSVLLGLQLTDEEIILDITSKAHNAGYKCKAGYGEIRVKGHTLGGREDFWDWLNPPKPTGLIDLGN